MQRPRGSVPMCPILPAERPLDVPEEVVELLSTVPIRVWLSLVTPAPLLGMRVESMTESLGPVERLVHRCRRVVKS